MPYTGYRPRAETEANPGGDRVYERMLETEYDCRVPRAFAHRWALTAPPDDRSGGRRVVVAWYSTRSVAVREQLNAAALNGADLRVLRVTPSTPPRSARRRGV